MMRQWIKAAQLPVLPPFENRTNPDFGVLETRGLSIGVDEIRNLQQDICIRPLYSKRKVYLIREAEKMTVQAQNCLLKTLEEPPNMRLSYLQRQL